MLMIQNACYRVSETKRAVFRALYNAGSRVLAVLFAKLSNGNTRLLDSRRHSVMTAVCNFVMTVD